MAWVIEPKVLSSPIYLWSVDIDLHHWRWQSHVCEGSVLYGIIRLLELGSRLSMMSLHPPSNTMHHRYTFDQVPFHSDNCCYSLTLLNGTGERRHFSKKLRLTIFYCQEAWRLLAYIWFRHLFKFNLTKQVYSTNLAGSKS